MTKKSNPTEKPLDKMTVKDLREVAKEIPEITGVHGMNKSELKAAIESAQGSAEAPETPKTPKTPKKAAKAPKVKTLATVQDIKQRIRVVAVQEQEARAAGDLRMAHIYKQRRHRLKKQTRRIK